MADQNRARAALRATEKRREAIASTAILTLLRERYPAKGWAFFPQVRSRTGYPKPGEPSERYADALALSLWPSKGIELLGFEIKVSRYDWRRELADPTKSAAISKFCSSWWVVAPVDVVPPEELPENWGLLEFHHEKVFASERRATLRIRRKAARVVPAPPDLLFFASLCRSLQKSAGVLK